MTYPGEPQPVATPITGSAYATPVNNYGYSTGQNYQSPAYSNPYGQTGYTTQQPNYGTMPVNGYNPNYNQQPTTNYPNQNYVPNNGTSNVTYNPQPIPPDSYNLYHIQYQQVTVDQWQSIPSEETEYSQYWSSPDAFSPSTYSDNTQSEVACNDCCWAIIFWIHFVAMIAFLIYMIVADDSKNLDMSFKLDLVKFKDIGYTVGIGLALAVLSNVIHFLFIFCVPKCYLGFGMIVGLIYVIVAVIFFAFFGGSMIGLIVPVLYLLLMIVFLCSAWKYIPFSAAILKQAAQLMIDFPGIICFLLLQVLWNIIVSALYSALVYYVQKRGIHNAVYLLVILSYLWSTMTFEYVEYLTVSGVASSWYFLNGTEYFPSSPILQSYKRAMTTSFGSASFAGFLIAIIQFLQFIIRSYLSSECDSDNGVLNILCCLLKCCALCILSILETLISLLSRYALIYCAAFGINYMAGAKRWLELECTRFVDILMNGCIVSTATTYNLLIYSIASAFAGFGFGYLIFNKNDEFDDSSKLLLEIFCCIFALLFTFGVFTIVIEPIVTLCDTLIVCFSECPENLKNTAYDLYEKLVEYYGDNLQAKISGLDVSN